MKNGQIYTCVLAELTANEEARKDDNALIVGVLRRLSIDTRAPFATVMRDKRLPSFEGIVRCRRKVQEDFPELKDKASAMIRDEKNRDFRIFAEEGAKGHTARYNSNQDLTTTHSDKEMKKMITIKIPSAKDMLNMPLREVESLLSLVSDDLKDSIVCELFCELHKGNASVSAPSSAPSSASVSGAPAAREHWRHSIVIITL